MNSQNTISAKKSVKKTVHREPKKTIIMASIWIGFYQRIKILPIAHAFMSELYHMALVLVSQLGFPFNVSDIWYVPW